MRGNQFKDLEVYRSKITEPQTKKNPFLWLIPMVFVLCIANINTHYGEYRLLQSVRGTSYELVLAGIDRFTLPETFKEDVRAATSEFEYISIYKSAIKTHKFSIGLYLALLIISLGLLWKDIISIFGTAVFLMITCTFALMQGITPYWDFSIFFILLYIVLMTEQGR